MNNPNMHVFEIKEYVIIWRQLEHLSLGGETLLLRALVRLIGGDWTMDVYFLADGSPVPAPGFLPDQKKGYLCLSIHDIQAFVDMVRNEKPIYAHLRGDRPEWTSVTTSREPVGEGLEKE